MSRKVVVAVFVLGVLALALAGLIPGMHSATTTNTTTTGEFWVNETDEFVDGVHVNVTRINASAPDADVQLTDVESQDRVTVLLNESEKRTVSLDGENVSVSLDSVRSSSRVVLTAEVSSLYGWPEGPRFFMENIGLLIVVLGGAMVFAVVAIGSKQ